MPRPEIDFSALDYDALSPAQRGAVAQLAMRQARVARAKEIVAVAHAVWRGISRTAALGWGGAQSVGRAGASAAATLWRRHQERRRRRIAATQLYAMDDRALRDIGLRRGEIEFAVSGAFDPTRRPRAASRRQPFVARDHASPSLQPAQRPEELLLARNGCAG